MDGRKISLTVIPETQNALGSNHRRGPAAGKSYALAPPRAVAVTRAGDVVHAFRQAMLSVFQQRNIAMRHRGDIACASRTWQANQPVLPLNLRGIEVTVA